MTTNCALSAGQIISDWVIPEGILQRQMGSFYRENPIMSRVIAAPLGAILGCLKVPLFPLICLVGTIAMPMIAIFKACNGEKKEACEWLKAWAFCVLGVAGTVAYFGLMCYFVPLIASTALLVAFTALSVIFHVQRLVIEPTEPPPFEAFKILS